MCSTRWYILAVAALIAAVYVSTQCRERYELSEFQVLDTWTGKVTFPNGELVPAPYSVPCCEGDPVDSDTGPIQPLPELQSVVPLLQDGAPVDEQEVEDFPVWHYKGSTEE